MKKILRITLASLVAGGMLFGAAGAEPTAPAAGVNQIEMALLGPDRSPRAPQRAVKAPVQRTETRRETVVTPPPPPVKPFVYEKIEYKTLTGAPMNLQGEDYFCYNDGARMYYFDDGRIVMWTPKGRFPVNSAGAMGADREFFRLEYAERMGVWANGRIADDSPRTIVSNMVDRIEDLTGGRWSEPEETTVAGVPVTMATGSDHFGNYYYEVMAWERFGNTYALATRVPYNTRYNTARNTELAYIVSHMHPVSWSE